ncbi:MAG TPA: hypothetical protein VFU45_07020 [Gemmatimonadales bacterium]|nr:hypothetical protein [Gemmatimonadales bacterium]
MSSQGDLVQVIVIIGSLILFGRLVRYIGPALARRVGGEADGGRRADALQADVDDLKARLADRAHDRDRLLELEERLDFTERMLAKPSDVRRTEH